MKSTERINEGMMGQAMAGKLKSNERLNVKGQGVEMIDCETNFQAMVMRVNNEGMRAGWV